MSFVACVLGGECTAAASLTCDLVSGRRRGSPEDIDSSPQVGEGRRRRRRRNVSEVVRVTAIPLIDVLLTGGVNGDVALVVRLLLL